MTDAPKNPPGPEEEKVGYKNPPKATRFTKGKSGNKKGRPKSRRPRDILELFALELENEILVQEGGKASKITKREAMVKRILAKALEGERKCMDIVTKADAAIAAERRRRDEPQTSGVLVVSMPGEPSLIAQALGLTLEDELFLHQRQYREKDFSTLHRAKEEVERVKKDLEEWRAFCEAKKAKKE